MDEVIRQGFTGPSIFAVRLALEEALANAIKHGNRLDRGKKVRVEAEVTPRQIRIVIEDEGGGFERSSVPDPTTRANLEKTGGRGILLIETYMDKVRWSRGGRRLEMIRRNADGPPLRG
ncbi:MAG: ATP-binding protein [Tepidisphaeraceae bacterium]